MRNFSSFSALKPLESPISKCISSGRRMAWHFASKRVSKKETRRRPNPTSSIPQRLNWSCQDKAPCASSRTTIYWSVEPKSVAATVVFNAPSQFCNLLITNGLYMPDVHALYYLASRSLDAFQERGTPDVVYLKSIFLLLKEEGFPSPNLGGPACAGNAKHRQTIHRATMPRKPSATKRRTPACTSLSTSKIGFAERQN